MHKKLIFIFVILSMCAGSLFFIYGFQKTQHIIIPKEILFANPEISGVRISPNGNFISYLAPGDTPETKDYLNIWLSPRNSLDQKQQITFAKHRSIMTYFWAFDNQHILYLQDHKGDENWQIFSLNTQTKKVHNCTPFDNVHATIIALDKKFPHTILIGLNKEDKTLHDVYKLNIKTGSLTCIAKNNGSTVNWLANNNLEICAALNTSNTGKTLSVRAHKDAPWHNIASWNYEDGEQVALLSFNKKNNALYILDCKNKDNCYLIKKSLINKPDKIIAEQAPYDISTVLFDPETHKPLAYSYTSDRQHWQAAHQSFCTTLAKLSNLNNGNLHIASHDAKQHYWILCFEGDIQPPIYYLYDAHHGQAHKIFAAQPRLEAFTSELCSIHPIQFTASDGLKIPGYITYPKINNTQSYPLVLLVHGGPWSRDTWRFNPHVQWLTNRGYAVLQINYRGSTGYGKTFINCAAKEWGAKMHQDLIDGVQWAINQGMIDSQKIAISGASYGGYAALAGAAFTPDVFCCAIDMVGPSNLITLLNSVPPHWHLYKKWLYKHLGDPKTESTYLKSISPLFKAHNIKIPILIAQGAHDPRVKQAESEQIVEALKKQNTPYEYLLFTDEGHGFINEKNRLACYTAYENFLTKYLR